MKETITKRIDRSVTLSFLLLFLVFAGLLAFKVSDASSCPDDINIQYKGNKYEVGELIEFVNSNNANKLEWDFGDNTKTEIGNNLFHKYEKPGEYDIVLRLNNACYANKLITILPKKKDIIVIPKNDDEPKITIQPATIVGANRIKVGATYTVKDESSDSKKWEWSFGDTYQSGSKTSRAAKHVYRKAGSYTIKLKTDNGEASKVVQVYDVDPPCPLITGEQFRNMLVSLATSKIELSHFEDYMQSNYINKKNVTIQFYSNSNIKLDLDKMSFKKFSEFIKANYNKYNINIEELYKTNINCIKLIEVNLTEKITVSTPVITQPTKPVDPVVVKPEKPEEKPNKTEVLEKLSVEDFTQQITAIYDRTKDPSVLGRYICDKKKIAVLMNDGVEKMSYEKFVERLQRKRLRMRKVTVTDLYYDDKTNCITKVKFNYRR